eukprot:6475318-Amphidinium_carterae.6
MMNTPRSRTRICKSDVCCSIEALAMRGALRYQSGLRPADDVALEALAPPISTDDHPLAATNLYWRPQPEYRHQRLSKPYRCTWRLPDCVATSTPRLTRTLQHCRDSAGASQRQIQKSRLRR